MERKRFEIRSARHSSVHNTLFMDGKVPSATNVGFQSALSSSCPASGRNMSILDGPLPSAKNVGFTCIQSALSSPCPTPGRIKTLFSDALQSAQSHAVTRLEPASSSSGCHASLFENAMPPVKARSVQSAFDESEDKDDQDGGTPDGKSDDGGEPTDDKAKGGDHESKHDHHKAHGHHGEAKADAGPKSVTGTELKQCSHTGEAQTGWLRSGQCIDKDDDKGSHHICMKVTGDFCEKTGQPDWCDEKMQCQGQDGKCPIVNWCVCQWAFAKYLQEAGGCDAVEKVDCGATNQAAVDAYKGSDDPTNLAALQCLSERCGFSAVVASSRPWRIIEGFGTLGIITGSIMAIDHAIIQQIKAKRDAEELEQQQISPPASSAAESSAPAGAGVAGAETNPPSEEHQSSQEPPQAT
eukprot:gnl/MRDRNA2_/MRDRNA2_76727_c0_seq1.p1 gnl/MRDRNA2_/MRDRNA2_76727_c0~~gnl/MRDRNA2_/MRDRNA2_76727_c0_seq1.p1  ORF type:complete len:464 (-),score=76.38 gnl/MRDRNA2_/MRDRNA2_76727_c0_seq1:26-1255(-)